jgi:hypothetical protein
MLMLHGKPVLELVVSTFITLYCNCVLFIDKIIFVELSLCDLLSLVCMLLRCVHCLWHHRLFHIPWTEGTEEENGAWQV